jgi:hypothetical protein
MRDKLRPPPRLSRSLSKRSAPNGANSPMMTYPRSRTRMTLVTQRVAKYGLEKPLAKCAVDALTNGSSDPEAWYPQPPKDFFTAVPFAAERYVDVYLAQRYCGPVFASGVPAATASIMAVTEAPSPTARSKEDDPVPIRHRRLKWARQRIHPGKLRRRRPRP